VSAAGPPFTKEPAGFIIIVVSSSIKLPRQGFIIFAIISFLNSALVCPSLSTTLLVCCVETKTVEILCGFHQHIEK